METAIRYAAFKCLEKFAQEDVDSHIVGGSEVSSHSKPDQAFISAYNATNNVIFVYGGSLISNTWVLTSAICVNRARTVNVTLGAHNMSDTVPIENVNLQTITSTDIRRHPDFSRTDYKNDEALIRLPTVAILNS